MNGERERGGCWQGHGEGGRVVAEGCRAAEAQCSLGACYANGKGARKDADTAAELHRKAAEQGHVDAYVQPRWVLHVWAGRASTRLDVFWL